MWVSIVVTSWSPRGKSQSYFLPGNKALLASKNQKKENTKDKMPMRLTRTLLSLCSPFVSCCYFPMFVWEKRNIEHLRYYMTGALSSVLQSISTTVSFSHSLTSTHQPPTHTHTQNTATCFAFIHPSNFFNYIREQYGHEPLPSVTPPPVTWG